VKQSVASRTAQAAAASRAIESLLPPEERLFEDPFALAFVKNPLWRAILALMRSPRIRDALLAVRDRQFPGALGNLMCRTRYIDEALRRALEDGFDRVVILGAGCDSRAYRIPGIDRARVFEVDMPATLAWKQEAVRRALGALPPHVTFVPIDFDRQSLADEMAAAGFLEGARTFFVWEGVTQYITAQAVDATFHYVSHAAARGSRIVFTFIRRGIIDGAPGFEEYQRYVALTRRFGSPWITGFDPAEMVDYLAAHGLALVEQVGALDYQVRYLDPIGRRLNVFEGELTALARVVTP
jgi:methyltransferase (TIGR00027 family)